MDIATSWRERLVGHVGKHTKLPEKLTNEALNCLVLQLPTGVFSMQKLTEAVSKNPPEGGSEGNGAGKEGSAAEYKIMPLEVSLQDYIQEAFFNTLKEPKEIPILTLPVYLTKEKLEKLEGWPDWMTLKGYLGTLGLQPFVVFKNIPKNIPNVGTCYLCDIRVGWVE
jgi:hypothetical protein